MESTENVVVRGLKDVIATETRLSFVDPNGSLYYSGYNIHDLAEHNVSFEEVIHLLWEDRLPNMRELEEVRTTLVSEMELPDEVVGRLKSTSPESHPMDVLRTTVSHLGEYDPEINDLSVSANRRKAFRLVAKIPTIAAYLYRIRRKDHIIGPSKRLGFASNILYMFRGTYPDEVDATAIDRYMMLHADHGLNASTFSARVTASTQSDMYSAITSAIGTLKGPLHGGASERVMMMLEQVNLGEVEAYIKGMLDDNKKIMGFGHRVYKAEDPRSKHLREMSEMLCGRINQEELHEKSSEIERVVQREKGIYPNVDFYAATVMHALRIPKEFFTALFACSRISGWSAHVMEQYQENVLIRPTSKYTGLYHREFVPIGERGQEAASP
ncbi:MAG TPA: citrate/2-methylcitrate synthase [Candidatus Bathyarchaeia archaeon]|nr:citrate/2-methylcitrate synthase [Candidatus Bathyarchaeia archaeon]